MVCDPKGGCATFSLLSIFSLFSWQREIYLCRVVQLVGKESNCGGDSFSRSWATTNLDELSEQWNHPLDFNTSHHGGRTIYDWYLLFQNLIHCYILWLEKPQNWWQKCLQFPVVVIVVPHQEEALWKVWLTDLSTSKETFLLVFPNRFSVGKKETDVGLKKWFGLNRGSV